MSCFCFSDLVVVSDRSNRRAAIAMTIPRLTISSKATLTAMDKGKDTWKVTPCPRSRCRAHLTPMNPLPSSMGKWMNDIYSSGEKYLSLRCLYCCRITCMADKANVGRIYLAIVLRLSFDLTSSPRCPNTMPYSPNLSPVCLRIWHHILRIRHRAEFALAHIEGLLERSVKAELTGSFRKTFRRHKYSMIAIIEKTLSYCAIHFLLFCDIGIFYI